MSGRRGATPPGSSWRFPLRGAVYGTVEMLLARLAEMSEAKRRRVVGLQPDRAPTIVPGLVNTHTHLEFSLVERPLEPALPFSDWIRSLVAYRRETFGVDSAMKLAALTAGCKAARVSLRMVYR